MAARGKDEADGFLSRWSQRKRAAEEAAAEAAATPSESQAPDSGDAAAGEQAVDLTELPDIDTLDAGSDFTVFMRKGVPEALKRRALRRLWQVDPAFHHICMLDDYNLDYTDAATVVPNLKTIYQVGRGMVLPEDDAPESLPAPVAEAGPDSTPAPAAATDEGAAARVASEEKPAEPEPRVARKPGTPLVPPPNRRSAEADGGQRAKLDSSNRTAASSARRRRWGDADS